jgi:predicted MFS family arabinose efflux permease
MTGSLFGQTMNTETQQKIWTREFILTSLGLFTLGSVFHLFMPTIPIYLSTLESTEIEIGILIAASGFSSLVFRPVVGRAVQRIPEKSLMIVGTLLYMVTSAAYLYAPPFWPFLTVRVLQGIGFAFFHTASFTLIAKISPEEYRGQSLSYFILSFNVASAIAPSAGMFLINQFSFPFLFYVCSGLSLCSLFISLNLKRRPTIPLQDSIMKDRSIFSRKALVPSTIGLFCLLIWGAIAAFLPLYAIGQGISNPGLFFTVFATMLILGRGLGGRILNFARRERIILFCLLAYIVSMGILAFSKTLPMLILVAAIGGIGHAFIIPTLLVYALEAGSSPGPAMGTFHALTDLGFSLGPVIMGMVLRFTSYPGMFLCLMLTGIINLIYFHFAVSKAK